MSPIKLFILEEVKRLALMDVQAYAHYLGLKKSVLHNVSCGIRSPSKKVYLVIRRDTPRKEYWDSIVRDIWWRDIA